ncbi:hypothetical protein BC938DRAFT_472187 [Jimgerdemannia flammicorona]|uniref:Uncharacterized protein n=1 Tax=Jimgerdemannia flammicorona TaxID=994334 RepID=A0A433Q6M9_9FUNG|nr:hypothetical protein BC938DRAFT_472187 [Jimgerdemannia flammicorona]
MPFSLTTPHHHSSDVDALSRCRLTVHRHLHPTPKALSKLGSLLPDALSAFLSTRASSPPDEDGTIPLLLGHADLDFVQVTHKKIVQRLRLYRYKPGGKKVKTEAEVVVLVGIHVEKLVDAPEKMVHMDRKAGRTHEGPVWVLHMGGSVDPVSHTQSTPPQKPSTHIHSTTQLQPPNSVHTQSLPPARTIPLRHLLRLSRPDSSEGTGFNICSPYLELRFDAIVRADLDLIPCQRGTGPSSTGSGAPSTGPDGYMYILAEQNGQLDGLEKALLGFLNRTTRIRSYGKVVRWMDENDAKGGAEEGRMGAGVEW